MSRCPAHPQGYHYFVWFGTTRRNSVRVCIDCGQHYRDAAAGKVAA